MRVAFEEFELDAQRRELLCRGRPLAVEPKVFDLLLFLVANRDRVVSKDELIENVWQGRIVSDAALDTCIKAARRAVGDDGKSQRLIKTVSRKGLRFVAAVVGRSVLTESVAPASQAAKSAPSQRLEPIQADTTELRLPDQPSIAVLPFENMSGDPEQAYFADGIAEDLINALSRISWFFVIARNSSFSFRSEKHDARGICQKLGVRYLVEGSVRKSGSRVRVAARLVDGISGIHLWGDKYDGPIDQIFELQDKITESLIGAIEPRLRSVEITRARRRHPESMSSFDLLLQALPHHWAMSCQGFGEAIKLLDRSIELAPKYAQALGYSAACRAFRPLHNCSPDTDRDFQEADTLAQRAIEADAMDPVALRSAAFVAVLTRRDYETALDLIGRSLAIDQNSALTWGYRGWIGIWSGDQETAINDFDKALRLSPFDQWISTYSLGRSFALTMSGRFEEGLFWARRAMQENPDWTASYRGLVAGLVLNGKLDEARTVAARLTTIDPNFSVKRWSETAPFRHTEGQEVFFSALRTAGLRH
ncbi:MAG: winged helix-turn-helix domain-containing protein [Hyphomicrobiaceae bacterium]